MQSSFALELVAFVLLTIAILSRAESILDVSIRDAIQTGIGRYAVPVGKTIQFRCATRQFPAARLTILRNDEVLLERIYEGPGKVAEVYDIVGEAAMTGNYTCRLYRKLQRKDSEPITFKTETTVEVALLTQANLPRCAASHGPSGLPDEQVTLFCGTFTYNPEEEILWRGLDTITDDFGSYKFYLADIQLNNQPSELSCGYYELESDGHEWTDICSLPPITVLPFMKLRIEPREFNERNEILKFTCYSDPPAAIIRWTIFGHANNIIDDYLVTKLKGEVVIQIKEAFGISTLELPSAVIETEGVHVVACSTTRENYQIAVSEFTNSPLQEPVTPMIATLNSMEESLHTLESIQCASSSTGSAFGFVIVIVLLVIIVFILVAISLWMFKNQRMSIKNNNRINRGHNAGALTAVQRNATYEPLSPQVTAPPAYTDLDVGYATMSTPELDDQHYMEPVAVSKE